MFYVSNILIYYVRFHSQESPRQLNAAVPPLCDGTKLSVDQYRDKLYEVSAG